MYILYDLATGAVYPSSSVTGQLLQSINNKVHEIAID
jgi:hypothetical protein